MLGRQPQDDFYVPSITTNRRVFMQYVVNLILLVGIFMIVVVADAGHLREFIVKATQMVLMIVEGCLIALGEIYEGVWTVLAAIIDFL